MVNNRSTSIPFLLISCAATAGLCYFLIGQGGALFALYVSLMALMLISCLLSMRLSIALLAFSMLLSPEIPLSGGDKHAVILRLEDILIVIMGIGWLLRVAFFKDVGFIRGNMLNLPIFSFIFIVFLSTSLGVFRGNVNPLSGFFFALKLVEYFVIFFITVNYIQTEADINRLISMMLIACLIVCIYGLFMGLTNGVMEAPFEGKEGERNTLGGYLVLMGSVATGILLNSTNRTERMLIGMGLPLLIIVLMFSISRSGWVSCITSIFILFINSKQKTIFFAILLLSALAMPFVAPDVVEDRINYTFHQKALPTEQFEMFGYRLDTSSSARIFTWLSVLQQFPNRPFLGYGMTGTFFVDGQFFRFLSELGAIGLGIFLWLLYSIKRLIIRASKSDLPPRLQGMVLGLHAAFWGMIVHALTANTFIIIRIMESFWFLVGLTMVCLTTISKGKTTIEPDHHIPLPGSVLYQTRG